MKNSHTCSICGGTRFQDKQVLWPDLIHEWGLSPDEVDATNRQQGRTCTDCGANWRSLGLAQAILDDHDYPGLFRDFVVDPQFQSLKVLEINSAGDLTPWLKKLPQHQLVTYPDVDMQNMRFESGSFDLVIHSDTLEHVPNPLQGLAECSRVLRQGGTCFFTVPIIVGRLSRSRSGLPASYHGNSSNPEDYRVFTEFGADTWTFLLRAGFASVQLHNWDFPSVTALSARTAKNARPGEPSPSSLKQTACRSTESEGPAGQQNGILEVTTSSSSQKINIPALPATGERLLTEMHGSIVAEHLHRYALAVRWAEGKDVLDIASGEGYGSNLLAEAAKSVVGVDVDPDAVTHASVKYQRPNLKYLTGDCRKIPLADASIDLAVSFETIEHIAEHEEFLLELKRVLRPNGILLISTPNVVAYRHGQTQNPYHVREVTSEEFLSSLRREFEHVSWATQSHREGSVIVPQEPAPRSDHFLTVRGSFDSLKFQDGIEGEVYLLAMATNGTDLPEWSWGCFTTESEYSLTQCQYELHNTRAELAAMKSSTSWKISAPIRWAKNFVASILPSRSSPEET